MQFEVREVKQLQSQEGLTLLSLRLEATGTKSDSRGPVKFTIHAVVPWDIAGFKAPGIGDVFDFERTIPYDGVRR